MIYLYFVVQLRIKSDEEKEREPVVDISRSFDRFNNNSKFNLTTGIIMLAVINAISSD